MTMLTILEMFCCQITNYKSLEMTVLSSNLVTLCWTFSENFCVEQPFFFKILNLLKEFKIVWMFKLLFFCLQNLNT